jgi:O-antigen ligase
MNYGSGQPAIARTLWWLACGFNAAVGTSLLASPYYLVPGISWIDMAIVVAALVKMLSSRPRSFPSRAERWHGLAVFGLSMWLSLSTVINALWYPTPLSDLLPPLKLAFFIALVAVVRDAVARGGSVPLLIGCLVGVFTVAVQDLLASERTVVGLPLLLNPNVTGAILGLGAWFAVYALVSTRLYAVAVLAALGATALSVTAFSKGAWIMCALALLAGIGSAIGRSRINISGRRMRVVGGIVVIAAAIATTVAVRDNYDLITELFTFKLLTTVEGGSATARSDFVVAAVKAALDHPIFGLGYRNYYQTQWLYPDLQLPPLERGDNAHNVFAQVLAVGGFPAASLLLVVFILPFDVLRAEVRWLIPGRASRSMFFWGSFGVWAVYGAVQLQMLAQPSFWFFCGLVFGLRYLKSERMAAVTERQDSHA